MTDFNKLYVDHIKALEQRALFAGDVEVKKEAIRSLCLIAMLANGWVPTIPLDDLKKTG